MINTNFNFEQGRSMVEMLGVLAVMGVLSVGGVAMYTSAMNKHRANELLNEASKRAVMVAGQLLTNPSATTMSLAQFGSNAVAGGTFGENAAIANGKITLTVSGVETAVCNQMKAATGDNAAMVVDDNCTKITFNTDMSKGSASTGGATCTETPTGCQACVGGELVDDDAKCDTGKVCVDGTCSSDALTGSGCAKNSDCETVAACTGGKCFCNFGGDVNDCTGPTGKNGTCTSVESFTESTDLAGFVRGKSTDWFSAKNFCAALPGNKRIAALSDFNCPYTLAQYKATGWGYCCAEEGSSIQSECPSDGWNTKLAAIKEDTGGTGFWIKDLTNNSCKAFAVDTGVSYVSYSDRSNPNSALCK